MGSDFIPDLQEVHQQPLEWPGGCKCHDAPPCISPCSRALVHIVEVRQRNVGAKESKCFLRFRTQNMNKIPKINTNIPIPVV